MRKLFLTALAALTLFASCSKDELQQGETPVGSGEKAKLTVMIAGSDTRATGDNLVSYNQDRNIANYVAITLDANGKIVSSAVSNSASPINELKTTTAAKKLLVISNLNTTLVSGGALKSSITDMATLEAAIDAAVDLANGQNAAIIKGTSKVWSAGEADIVWSTLNEAEDAYEETVAVTIHPVAAKVNLVVNMPAGYGDNTASFMMNGTEGIMVLNAVSKTKFFGAKAFTSYTDANYPWLTPNSKAYYSGMDISNSSDFVNENTTTVKNFLKDNFTGIILGTSTSKYHYYLFENNGDKAIENPTIVTLKGTWGMDLQFDNPDHFDLVALSEEERKEIVDALKVRDVYFQIHLTSVDAGKEYTPTTENPTYGKGVQRGKCYNITLTLTDNVFEYPDGGGFPYKYPANFPINTYPPTTPPTPPGTVDPTEEVTDANCKVTVTVANWVGMDIDKEW